VSLILPKERCINENIYTITNKAFHKEDAMQKTFSKTTALGIVSLMFGLFQPSISQAELIYLGPDALQTAYGFGVVDNILTASVPSSSQGSVDSIEGGQIGWAMSLAVEPRE